MTEIYRSSIKSVSIVLFLFGSPTNRLGGERFESQSAARVPPHISFRGTLPRKLGAREERHARLILPGIRSNGLLDGLHREFDLDDVTQQEATGLQGQVPGQAEVLAVDLRAGIASTEAFPCLLNDSAPRSEGRWPSGSAGAGWRRGRADSRRRRTP
jgi:hypothetical protein